MKILPLIFAVLLGSAGSERNLIAYSRLTGDYWQIWTKNLDTGKELQLTQGAHDKRHPAWSPDGKFLFYSDNGGALFRISKDGGEPVRMLESRGSAADPAVSPQGRVAFTHVEVDPVYRVEVWNCDLEGKDPIKMTREPVCQLQAAWSPDARQIAVTQVDIINHQNGLIVMNADGSNSHPLVMGKGHFATPSWSPDGRFIVYATQQQDSYDIWSVELSDPKPKRLTFHPSLDLAPVFSPDGTEILFVSRRSGSLQLWKMPFGEEEPVQITLGSEPCREPAWFAPQSSNSLHLSAVRRAGEKLNPEKNEKAMAVFQLDQPANVELEVLNSKLEKIRTVKAVEAFKPGEHFMTWDGKEDSGKLALPGIYFLRLNAQNESGFTSWDPTRATGGQFVSVKNLRLDPLKKKLSFEMPSLSFVRVRLGISGTAMLENLMNWQVVAPGAVELDYPGDLPLPLGNFWDRDDRLVWVVSFALPDNAVLLASENSKITHADFHVKPSLAPRDLLQHARHDSRVCGDFEFKVEPVGEFSKDSKGNPIVKDRLDLRIDGNTPEMRRWLENERFEVMVFLDGIQVFEDEDSSLPFHYPLDLSRIPDGPHNVLVNLGGYQDHYGSRFVTFQVKR